MDGPVTLGAHDPFTRVTTWDRDTAEQWVEVLERRATSPDQVRFRRQLVQAAALRPGDTAVELGCGSGPLLAELAAAVGPTGRVVGVEPQEVLGEAARRRLAAAGLDGIGTVVTASADDVPLPDGQAAACLAQTVLIHLPEPVLDRALGEMVRLTRPGGRVVTLDQDGDTWIVDHPDRELTRRIVTFHSDQRYADGWTGRRLLRMFRSRGLRDVSVQVSVHVDTEPESFLHLMARRLAGDAVAAGAITADEAGRWVGDLDAWAAGGDFFASVNYHLCVGTRP